MQIKTAALVSLVFFPAVTFASSDAGKTLHDANCTKCHDTSVYTRATRQMSTLPMLSARVQSCYKVAGAKWTDAEVKSVVDYLNSSFYKFPAK